jgi:aminoglycoside phosphotransferase (APT) family kinase protein
VPEAADLIERIRSRVVDADLGLDASALAIDPVLNWGGFVNRSFRLSDGRTTLLVKLASSSGARSDLERWRQLAGILAERYRAPRMVGWIDVDAVSGGPVFEWIDGITPARLDQAPVAALVRMLADLRADDDLRASLEGLGDDAGSCAEAYRDSYHRRFMADLAGIAGDVPPFVDRDTIEWMRSEALRLEARVAAAAAFAEPADRPVHGDLWLNNLIVRSPDDWRVLDWDGVGLGDPVVDLAMLFGPSRDDVGVESEARAWVSDLTAAEGERFDLYARAALLDWVIDPLADWVDAADEPFHAREIRAGAGRVHREALAAYRARYGEPTSR